MPTREETREATSGQTRDPETHPQDAQSDARQTEAPYPSPQDALHDGGDAEDLATDAADTPEAEADEPGAVPGHAVSTRIDVDGHDPSEQPDSEATQPDFPQTAAARARDED